MTTACLAPNGVNVYGGGAPANRLLVATSKGVAILDRGARPDWRHSGTALEGQHISSLMIEPVRGGIYAGVHRGGVFFSGDDGQTWESRSDGLSINHVYTLACAVENGEAVLYAGTEPAVIFRSRDEGRTWKELPGWRTMKDVEKWMFPMPPHVPHVKSITIDPRDPKCILAGVEQGGLFKTTDGGNYWVEIDSYAKSSDTYWKDIHQVVHRPNHPDQIFMTSGMGLYRSSDNGQTWVHLTTPDSRVGYPDPLLFSPTDDGVIYLAGSRANPGTWFDGYTATTAVMVSRDFGETCTVATEGMPASITANLEAMSVYGWPGGFELYTGGTDGTVYCSSDGAQHWRLIGKDLGAVSKVEHYLILIPGAMKPGKSAAAAAARLAAEAAAQAAGS